MYTSEGTSFDSFQSFFWKSFTILILVNTFLTQQMFGQFTDSFSDGEFLSNPSWSGSTAKFTVSGGELQLSAPAVSDHAYLFATSEAINDATWEFTIRMGFNPSSTNFARTYLTSDAADVTGSVNGYFVMIGNTTDEISLYRQDGITRTRIIDGTDGKLNLTAVNARIKVTRSAAGDWQLFSDVGVTGSYVSEGVVTDQTHQSSSFFALYCEYTSTRSDKFYFDNFSVSGTGFVDQTAPEITNVEVVSDHSILVSFSEEIASTSQLAANYSVDGMGNPISVTVTSQTQASLEFGVAFPNGVESALAVGNIEDLSGNKIQPVTKKFLYFQPGPVLFKDIVITEIYADFSPVIGLPEGEFVELFNRSTNPIDLGGWQITDGTSTGLLTSEILLPGEYLILTANANVSSFQVFGQTMGVTSFPTLNNGGDKLKLKNGSGEAIDSANYTLEWYHDENKETGGWSIELIDPDNFCLEDANWSASTDANGGTPGQVNTVDNDLIDSTGPMFLEATLRDSISIVLSFDERLNTSPPSSSSVLIEPSIAIESVDVENGASIVITTEENISPSRAYKISLTGIYDCAGNEIQPDHSSAYLNRDDMPPTIMSLDVLSDVSLRIIFSEEMDIALLEDETRFAVVETQANPVTAIVNDPRSVTITFDESFSNGTSYSLSMSGLKDVNGNSIDVTVPFMFFEAAPVFAKDIVINEIFPDPSPTIGLPEAEFVELYNRSPNPIRLTGWTISDGATIAILSNFIILPDSYLVLSNSAAVAGYESYGKTMGLAKPPSLNNDGDVLILRNELGLVVDSISYNKSWYGDVEFSEGGRTLERIDPDNLCAEESNWRVSEADEGGTPGRINSIYAEKPDLSPPSILRVVPENQTLIRLDFSEKLSAVTPERDAFSISEDMAVTDVAFVDGSLRSLHLSLSSPLRNRILYSINVFSITDCAGNILDNATLEFALPEDPVAGDLVINEVLFNPPPAGVDFIEIYNKSDKYIPFRKLQLATMYDSAVTNINVVTESDFLIFPGQYVAFTTDKSALANQYPLANPDNFFEVDDLPSMPDDQGAFAVIDHHNSILDGFAYSKSMHSIFIKDEEGVSLERISTDAETSNSDNWKSASSASGYGTPGYANSNSVTFPELSQHVLVSPRVFQPGMAGQGFALIHYNFPKGGWVANVKVFDPQGRVVKTITENELLGTQGFMRWDGDDDNGQKARIGYYMVLFEVFDERGNLDVFRKGVVIAGRF